VLGLDLGLFSIWGRFLPPLSIVTPQVPLVFASHYNTPRKLCEKKDRWRENKQSALSPN
jgi:hypothetical protein